MPYETKWLIEGEIIYSRFWGISTEDELRQALTQVAEMRDNSSRDTVHTITDTSKVTQVLPFQDSLRVVKEFDSNQDDSWEIVVGKMNSIMKLSLSISRSVLKTKVINLQTIDEAIEHLKKEDPDLTWEKMNDNILMLD